MGVIASRDRARPSFALDTSALGEVLSNASVRRAFVSAVQRRNAGVFISDVVVLETTSGEDTRALANRVRALKGLCGDLGHRSCFRVPDYQGLMREEGKVRVDGPPTHRSGWAGIVDASKAELRRLAGQCAASAASLQRHKKVLHAADRSLGSQLASRGQALGAQQAAQEICSSALPRPEEMMIEQAARLSDGRWTAAEIAGDKVRFKAAHAISHWVWRLHLANGVDPSAPCVGQAAHDIGLWRTKRGNKGTGAWYDGFVAAASAYVGALITEDDEQRRRVEFLRKRSLVSFRAEDLAGFIG